MSKYSVEDEELSGLSGKVILITGAATGIGRSTAKLAHRNGAKVAFCDVNEAKGRDLERELKTNILFNKCDVSNWGDVASFFEETYSTLGPIDAVISNAASNKHESTAPTSTLTAPDLSVLNVNLIGTWYVATCAIHFFNKHPDKASQLVLMGSVASYIDTPPLYTYCASKSGVLGLMRGLRTQLLKHNISVNMIAPWFTITAMVAEDIKRLWGDLPANTPEDVAKASLVPVIRPEINGKSFIVHGKEFTDVEDKLDQTQHLWMGSELDEAMREGQRRLIP
ncbi:hypothetical protein CNYM01_05458 [Colletotrichum nymphaeae SA-01]|uniref:Uncharacterized protein n=1 Tax=Colletotrichum nymphaeae SA-01 TaxID=1460502 RepID=A0A135SYJ6_9PEZI|nr:hypothetical protein CNYM01_05458 [Colletotrichum nymphaeae SA-01]